MNNNDTKMTTRIEWIDALKGIVICLVVFGHNIQYGSGEAFLLEKEFYNNNVFKFIYSFHMPCFMLISGFFFGYTIKKPDFFRDRVHSLLVPITVWSMIPTCIRIAKQVFVGKLSFKTFISTLIRTQLMYYWFLWAVLVCSIVVWAMYKLSLDGILYFVIILVVFLFANDWLNTSYWKYMFPYFVIGYLWNIRGKYIQINRETKCFLILPLMISFLILLRYYNESSYIYTTGIQINSLNKLLIDIYRYVIGLVGALALILLVNFFYSIFDKYIPVLNKPFVYLGKISLTIYVIDNLLNDYVIRVITKGFSLNYVTIIIETLLVIIFCILFDLGIKRIPVARKILLGSR
jgi:fucose 4-O-acetylase-like acetyltransferase